MARHFEPTALDRALLCFPPDLLQQIADELRHLPFDWMDTHPVPVAALSNPVAAQHAPRTVRMMWTSQGGGAEPTCCVSVIRDAGGFRRRETRVCGARRVNRW